MIDFDEVERRKRARIARATQFQESLESQKLRRHAQMPGFAKALVAEFVAVANSYSERLPSQSERIEIQTDIDSETWLTLNRLAVGPYASLAVTCTPCDSSSETLTCVAEGYGINGEREQTSFEFTLKARGEGIGIYCHGELAAPKQVVAKVMTQFVDYLS